MATLISKSATKTLSLSRVKAFHLRNGDMLITGCSKELDEAFSWMETNGLQGVYFNPEDNEENYNSFMFISIGGNEDDSPVGITLYNE